MGTINLGQESNNIINFGYTNSSGVPTANAGQLIGDGQGHYTLVINPLVTDPASARDIKASVAAVPNYGTRVDFTKGIKWGTQLYDESFNPVVVGDDGNLVPVVDDVKTQYDNLFNEITANYDNQINNVSASGQQTRADITQGYANLGNYKQQGLVKNGLSGTTILPTMQAGVERQKNAELNRFTESQDAKTQSLYKDKYNLLSGLLNPSLLTSGFYNLNG